jgi:hypothetical protein
MDLLHPEGCCHKTYFIPVPLRNKVCFLIYKPPKNFQECLDMTTECEQTATESPRQAMCEGLTAYAANALVEAFQDEWPSLSAHLF